MDINKMTEVLSLSCLTLLTALSIVIGDFCGNDYEIVYGCDETIPNIVGTLGAIPSITMCAWRCSNFDGCLSVKYDLDNRTCQLNSERYLSNNSDCQVVFEYAILITRSFGKLINQDCTVSDECSVSNSECNYNTCQCAAGYSYNYKNETCVESCDTYGSTFTQHVKHRLYHADNKHISAAKTTDTCEQACIDETSFVCRSITFWSWNSCFVSPHTVLTPSSSYQAINDCHHYQRNCQ